MWMVGLLLLALTACSADDRKARLEVEKQLLQTAQDCLKDPACKQAVHELVK